MTYASTIEFLYGLRFFGAKFGLENTRKLAALVGNPQARLRFIHVAGTNGKGSTCAMLESVYRAAGLRVGMFTSPHLVAFGERIQINRCNISERDLVRLASEMRGVLEEGWGSEPRTTPHRTAPLPLAVTRSNNPTISSFRCPHPTFFEVVTVMALRYFAEQRCDLVIWETGLGGRLDATNIVKPLASVITNVHYDHQQWLGETLTNIAAEKAGIIKEGTPVITGTEESEALKVIEETARKANAPLTKVTLAAADTPPLEKLELPLRGRHQRLNAAVALATIKALKDDLPVMDEQIVSGLRQVNWPGRLQ